MLTATKLPGLAARGIAVPSYARTGPIGVVHLGLGAFHRSHQALVFDTLLQRGDTRWGVLGVAMRSTSVSEPLKAQDGLYSIQLASSMGVSWRIGGAVWHTCVAAQQRADVVRAIGAADTRWLTLTITEKGYQPELAGLIVQGLALRRAAGLAGLTIASCDNLSHNGDKLLALCSDAALKEHGPALEQWLRTACTFPNSMVDRIVPAASASTTAAATQALGVTDQAALATEAFWEWVIERRFVDPSDADTLASAGVTVVDDVAPFEEAKLRMLNASHSAMACIGGVAGLPVISDCVAVPSLYEFVFGLMTSEVAPLLRRADWQNYRDALLARFANPALRHSVHQIATDTSLKIPQRWVPAVRDALHAGMPVERFAFAAAAWLRYLRGLDDKGNEFAPRDPRAEHLCGLAREHASDTGATVRAIATLTPIWGEELAANQPWLARVAENLEHITRMGMLEALSQLNTHCSAQSARHAP